MALTRYKEGSLGELATIAVPLVLSTMCAMGMIFTDRLLLAQYSAEAMNAATNAATTGWSFLLAMISLSGIAEAFVAQNNGAQRYREVGSPIWQMMWLSLFALLIFLPLSLWGAPFLFAGSPYYDMQVGYFEILMLMGPIVGMNAALSAFWIGRGKASLITGLSIFANLLNLCLDYLFIFGVEEWIPAMGTHGAAIATFIGEGSLTVIFFVLMLRKENRQRFGTGDCSFDRDLFFSCLRVGLPSALFVFIEVFGWSIFYQQMTRTSFEHITIASVAQSLVILLWGPGEGLSKAMVTIAGNRIGEGRPEAVWKSLRTSAVVIIAWHCVGFLLLFLFVDNIWGWFLDIEQFSNPLTIRSTLRWVIVLISLYGMIETLRFSISGVLTAAGDTLFLMFSGVATMWLFVVLPVELFVVKVEGSVLSAFMIWVLYAIAAFGINGWRLYSRRWQKRSLLQEKKSSSFSN